MKIKIDENRINKKNGFLICFLLIIIIFLLIWVNVSMAWRRQYDEKNFNCVDMSRVCGRFFKNLGIPVQIVHGVSKCDSSSGHCWLLLFGCIEFESTTLYPEFFNKNSDEYNVYSIEEL
jgi:hypothetical protein